MGINGVGVGNRLVWAELPCLLDRVVCGNMLPPMATKGKSVTSKMKAYRDRLRAQGLKPVQIWVPDVHAPGFKAELRRQVAALNEADEAGAMAFIEAVMDDPANDLSR